MLNFLKKEANKTYTENGAVTYASTNSNILDLFATVGALRAADKEDIIKRFQRAYAENADLAMKTLFFARDIRGGLGERNTFKIILKYLATYETESARKNLEKIAEYGRYDDLLVLIGTELEKDMIMYFKKILDSDIAAMNRGEGVSLLAKWLPSVNASNAETVRNAKIIAKGLGYKEAQYRKILTSLRGYIKIIENNLRNMDYSFDYSEQPSKALYKYRKAFIRNDNDKYMKYINAVEEGDASMNTKALTPCDVIAPIVGFGRKDFSEDERKAMNTTWNLLEDYAGSENSLVVVDGSGSMYGYASPSPAAVAQSLAIYFAERNNGAFHNHFITFSTSPKLVEIKGRDIVEKVRYCMGYNEVANTDLEKVFELLLNTAVKNKLKQKDMPGKLYIISDMEFDYCTKNASLTNFENAKKMFKMKGYKLPKVIFWNVASRNNQLPVTKNEQGVALVSGNSPQIFGMLSKDNLDPYGYMMDVLMNERYKDISA